VSQTYRAIALCALGLEKVLQAELERLGFKAEGREAGRVCFSADAAGLFRANLCLRTAERILLEVSRFPAPDFDALFEGARNAPWELFFAPEDKLVIERVRCNNSKLAAQTAVQSVAHKAIYEKLGAVHGLSRLPETGAQRSLRVYVDDDVCSMGLDLSGEALHKRGYRTAAGEAPLKETIAAALLFLAGWNHKLPLLDPFCGSGTLLIEAGLLGLNRAPGLDRSFAIENMPIAELGVFQAEREAARSRIVQESDLILAGSDEDAGVLKIAAENAERAGLGGIIKFSQGKAEDAAPIAPVGLLIANPPYGERLGTEEEALALYRRLSPLRERFKGWGIGFVTNRADFGQYFGRRAVSEHRFLNGSEEQWFHWYPIGFESRPERPPREQPPEAAVKDAAPARAPGGHGDRAGSYGAGSREGGRPDNGHGDRAGSYGAGSREGGRPDHGHGDRARSYGAGSREGGRPDHGHGDRAGSYGAGSREGGAWRRGPDRSDRADRPAGRDSTHTYSDHDHERSGFGHSERSPEGGFRDHSGPGGHAHSGRRPFDHDRGPRADGAGRHDRPDRHGRPDAEGRPSRFERDDPRLPSERGFGGHSGGDGFSRRRFDDEDDGHFEGEAWREDEIRRKPRSSGRAPDRDLLSEKRDIQGSNAGPAKPTLLKKEQSSSFEKAKKPLWSGRPGGEGEKHPRELSGFGGERGPGIGRKTEERGAGPGPAGGSGRKEPPASGDSTKE